MSVAKKALIVGGGVGGLSLAIGLGKLGIDVDIVEIKTAWTVSGVGIIQPANALRALDMLGVGRQCVDAGAPYNSYRMHTYAGQKMTEVIGPRHAGPDYPGYNGIFRGTLHTILSEAALALGSRVRLGLTVSAFVQDAEGVEVTFSDGSQGRYDLMVGSDGVYSKVRTLLFPDSAQAPVFSGQGVWRFIVDRPPHFDAGMFYINPPGEKTKVGFIPLTSDKMYLLLVTEEPGNPRKSENELHTIVQRHLAPYGGFIAEIGAALKDPSGIVYKPLEWIFRSEPWYSGRVVLIGDAVHSATPHLGQGAAMAIEDAVVLADELNTSESVEDALKAFFIRRFDRCRQVAFASVQLGEWEQRPTASMRPLALAKEIDDMLASPP